MSDLLIKGMEMPESCADCYFKYVMLNTHVKCELFGRKFLEINETGRLPDCPLVPVEEHGRLIDADELKFWLRESYVPCILDSYKYVIDDDINEAPTIIPASKQR